MRKSTSYTKADESNGKTNDSVDMKDLDSSSNLQNSDSKVYLSSLSSSMTPLLRTDSAINLTQSEFNYKTTKLNENNGNTDLISSSVQDSSTTKEKDTELPMWIPSSAGFTDLALGLMLVIGSLAGTIFDSKLDSVSSRFQHEVFLIYGIYGIFITCFGALNLIATKQNSRVLFLIFLIWKLFMIVFTCVMTALLIILVQIKVLNSFQFCGVSSYCVHVTTAISAVVGIVIVVTSIVTCVYMRKFLILAKIRIEAKSHLLSHHSILDDIESSFIDFPEVGQDTPRSPLRTAAIKFNHKPELAIEYLLTNRIINDSPDEIARFLLTTDNLNLTKIGEFISEPKSRNAMILKSMANYFDFKGMEFDEAIRAFLSKFRLPGEAQKIDRIMETFARRYCECNSDIFPSSDTAYVLAFAVIMLNTDAHNRNIKKKMSKKEFVYNNRGIADGKDLPTEFLENLYDKILQNEIKLNSEELFVKAVKKGWLRKMGRNNKWQRHWFVVANNCLYYFTKQEDQNPKVIIPLEGLSIRENSEYKGKLCFELYEPNNSKIKSVKFGPQGSVEGQHDRFLLEVEKPEDYESWLAAVKKNIILSPVIQLLNVKRKKLQQSV